MTSKKDSKQRNVEIMSLPARLDFDAQPMLLMTQGIAGKRAEAGQWYMEIRKLYKSIIDHISGLELSMNQQALEQKVTIDGNEILISPKRAQEIMVFFVENSLFRLFACLDKYAQMVRTYYEYPKHGGSIIFKECPRCGKKNEKEYKMDDKNCNLGSLFSVLKKHPRNLKIDNTIETLYNNKNIINLRPYRSGIAHKKSELDSSMGLDPEVRAIFIPEGGMKTTFTIKNPPNINWFRIEIVNSLNAIVNAITQVSDIIFPPGMTRNINSDKAQS